jgi:hypothetical protein
VDRRRPHLANAQAFPELLEAWLPSGLLRRFRFSVVGCSWWISGDGAVRWRRYGFVGWPGSSGRRLQPSLAHGDPGYHDHGAERFVPGQGLTQDSDAQRYTGNGGEVGDGGGVGGPPFAHHVGVPYVGQPGSQHAQGATLSPTRQDR